ncbi:MAG TPA: hypothetical protein PK926_05815 [Spirochaetota bacterium]|nr:hypothetical protein [Spirochaetota bacterium]HPI87720.1 hypothetical protein [Spirochaetota bacterium]HPR48155.1 hypothetical protein [Spirochaetota bacterium]
MKIRTDVNEVVYTPQKNVKSAVSSSAKGSGRDVSVSPDPQIIQSIASRINAERSLGEALSIAQASHSLLQKAMIISSQLRNMAVQAAATGKVNSSDLGIVLSDINSSLNSAGSGIVAPVNAYIQPVPELPQMPSIGPELNEIASTAEMFQNEQPPRIETIDTLIQSITNKSAVYETYIRTVSEQMNNLGKDYAALILPGTKGNSNYRDMILQNPVSSITAQGNIPSNDVYRILNS